MGKLLSGTALATLVAAGLSPALTINQALAASCGMSVVGNTEIYNCTSPSNTIELDAGLNNNISASFGSTDTSNIWYEGISVWNENLNGSVDVRIYGGGAAFPGAPSETLSPITISGDAADSEGHDYDAVDIYTHGGDASFITRGDVTLESNYDGLNIETDGGNVLVATGADIDAGEYGMEIYTDGGNAVVISLGDIDAGYNGIDVNTDDGFAFIYTGVDSDIDVGENGIDVYTGDGTAVVWVAGDIDAGEDGVHVETDDGDVYVNIAETSTIYAYDDGVDVETWDGDINVRVAGEVNAKDEGINLYSEYGDVKLSVIADAEINSYYNGIDIGTEYGDISVRVAGDIYSGDPDDHYEDDGADAINLSSEEGDIELVVARSANIHATSDGIYASTDEGDIRIRVAGDIEAWSDGIDANSEYGDIGIVVARNSHIQAGDNGIEAENYGGDINIRVAGFIEARDNGIDIETYKGDTFVEIARTGRIDAADDGINVDASSGDIALLIKGKVRGGDSAIEVVDSEHVKVEVGKTGLLVGEGSEDHAVVDINADEEIWLVNYGTIRSDGDNRRQRAGDLAINYDGGADSMSVNYGSITGRFDGSKGDDTFVNLGKWTFTGESRFGKGDNGVYNAGLIQNAVRAGQRETAIYRSVDTFVNAGVLSLHDQELGDEFRRDRVFIDGDYEGKDGLIVIDADLGEKTVMPDMIGRGAPPPQVAVNDADRVIIKGDVSGTTYVAVNNIGKGDLRFDTYGIPIIEVDGRNYDASFELANGPIDGGWFSYNLHYTEDMTGRESNGQGQNSLATGGLGESVKIDGMWVLAASLDAEAYQAPVITYAASNLWHAGTGIWGERSNDLRASFAGSGFGGGGADIIVDPAEPAAPVASRGGPGIWGRVFGGTQERDVSNTFDTIDGPVTYEDSFRQNYYGFIGGLDFAREVGPNSAWMFGVLGAYTGSEVDFDLSDASADYQQGSVGAYVTYLNGGFFADALVKADFGTMDYRGGGDSGSADYTSVGVTADVGYRFGFASGWFFEPKATLAYVHTDFDDLDLLGAAVEFDGGESLRGRLGARVGTSFDKGGKLITPYLEASVWNEFDGDYEAGFSGIGAAPGVNYDIGGAYGEVAAGADIVNVGSGWSAFAKGAVQFGEDNLVGVNGNLGLRKSW